MFRRRLLTLTVAGAALAATTMGVPAAASQAPVDVRLIGLNDLHGNIAPPPGSSGQVALPDGTSVTAGGAAYLATHVKRLKAQQPNSIVLSSGDNIGASPLNSALFHDEPTIDFLNDIGVAATTVGNHELDEGYAEMRRMQTGGCHPTDGCQFDDSFAGADFPYLAANMTYQDKPAAAPFKVEVVHGVPIAIIGAPLKEMSGLVSADSLKGMKFTDEVAAIDRSANFLDRIGIKTIVASIHQGDMATGGPNDCDLVPGPATKIAKSITPKVDAVFSAHSHQQYNCVLDDPAGNPRPFVQGSSYGRLLSVVDLKVDPRTRDVIRQKTKAHNEIVTRDVPADPTVAALVKRATEKSAKIANEPVGKITADIPARANAAGEEPLGDVIADAQLEATKPASAQLALMNPGGIRADLTYAGSSAGEGDGVVTYGEAYSTQPFANILQTITVTGAQLKAVLEQQWQKQDDGSTAQKILQVSSTLHYRWSAAAPIGSKVSAITVAGEAVDPAAKYRVTANNFLTGGGDGFTELTKGTDSVTGAVDIDALNTYLGAHLPLAPPTPGRITS
jgi:5'-nucleotidase